MEVNGSTPGSGHDQLDVTGSVTINGATLSTSGSITSSPGQAIVLINNDGTDAVTLTSPFVDTMSNALAEGATVTINSVNFILSYAGGADANDVVLYQAGAALSFSDDDGAADNWTVRRVGTNVQILNGSTVVDSRPISTVASITINGENGK